MLSPCLVLPCREPDAAFELGWCPGRSALCSGSRRDGMEAGSGWAGHILLSPLGPSQLPGELEQGPAELCIAMVFPPEGLGLAGEAPPRVTGGADCLTGSVAGVILTRPHHGAGKSRAQPALLPGAPRGTTAFTTALPCVGGWKSPLVFPEGWGFP